MNKNKTISEHFSYEEVIRSSCAIENNLEHCQWLISQSSVENARFLAMELLEPIRAHALNGRAMHVTSWYRALAVNEKIPGSATNSRHMTGCAVDFTVTGLKPATIVRLIRVAGLHKKARELIAYDHHVHIAISSLR